MTRKELKDWSRDRRSIITVLFSSLLAPVIIGVMFTTLANRARQVEDVTVPVVGGANAPALMDWLRQQAGVTIVEGPSDPEEAVRSRQEDVVVVIDDDFANRLQGLAAGADPPRRRQLEPATRGRRCSGSAGCFSATAMRLAACG